MMPLFDFLLLIVFFAAMMNGYRRGIISDILIFGLWVPVVFVSIYIFTTQMSVKDMDVPASAREMLEAIGMIYLFGQITIWLVDKFMLRPAFADRGGNLQDWNRNLGGLFAIFRTFVVLLALFMVYESQVKNLSPDTFKGSFILTELQDLSVKGLLYASDKGWINYERVLYEAPEYNYAPKDDSLFGVFGL